jgi:MinD superfamily P-loop ATPase
MMRIVFLSGKGGTGKTTLAAAFAARAGDLVLVDADVDAANLHLLFNPRIDDTGAYVGSKVAVRNAGRCERCGRCRAVCRFGAIDERYEIDPLLCEGCGACMSACPTGAIDLVEQESGTWYLGRASDRPMVGAELHPGEEASGKLVSFVKRKADEAALAHGIDRLAIDGSPGIGCPVIASATGAGAAVLVTEPSRAGLHDLDRILGVVRHFGIPAFLILNKADLSEELAAEVEAYAREHDLPLLGRIPYDRRVVDAMRLGRDPAGDRESAAGRAMVDAIDRFLDLVRDLERKAS